jgi:hypothetical protein
VKVRISKLVLIGSLTLNAALLSLCGAACRHGTHAGQQRELVPYMELFGTHSQARHAIEKNERWPASISEIGRSRARRRNHLRQHGDRQLISDAAAVARPAQEVIKTKNWVIIGAGYLSSSTRTTTAQRTDHGSSRSRAHEQPVQPVFFQK